MKSYCWSWSIWIISLCQKAPLESGKTASGSKKEPLTHTLIYSLVPLFANAKQADAKSLPRKLAQVGWLSRQEFMGVLMRNEIHNWPPLEPMWVADWRQVVRSVRPSVSRVRCASHSFFKSPRPEALERSAPHRKFVSLDRTDRHHADFAARQMRARGGSQVYGILDGCRASDFKITDWKPVDGGKLTLGLKQSWE
jgi:hypothetical protein